MLAKSQNRHVFFKLFNEFAVGDVVVDLARSVAFVSSDLIDIGC